MAKHSIWIVSVNGDITLAIRAANRSAAEKKLVRRTIVTKEDLRAGQISIKAIQVI